MVRRHCYHADESFIDDAHKSYVVIWVDEGEPGYFNTGQKFPTVEAAQKTARMLNDSLGLSETDVLEIRASSMAAGR